jgi:hypothetical protein
MMVGGMVGVGGGALTTGPNFGEISLVVAKIWGIEVGGVEMTMIIINGCGKVLFSSYICIVPYIQYFCSGNKMTTM